MKIEALETLAFHVSHVKTWGYPNSVKWFNHWTAKGEADGVNIELLTACVGVAIEKGYIPSFKYAVKAYMILSGAGIEND